MTGSPRNPSASPACSLSEAPDAYRGYLTPAEIVAEAAAILAALERDGRGDLAGQLRVVFPSLPEAKAADDVSTAFSRLLPRIADDGLHGRLRAIRDAL